MSNACDCWNRERARRRDCLASRDQFPNAKPHFSAFPANSSRFSPPPSTNHLATMSEFKDEHDLDMLFDDGPESSDGQNAFIPVGPQLSRPNKHSSVIARIEAVFETVADALLNERADVTISLTSPSGNESRDTSVRTPKAVFTFPGKTANDAWRFCR
jgi:hypothetical protein